jgi:ATP-dependent DNA helicase RecG
MVDEDQLAGIIGILRARGAELTDVEVKAAVGGLPKSVAETLSAFANGSGGTLILGLDEKAGYVPAQKFAADRIRPALADACHDQLQPPVRAEVEIVEFDGALLVVAVVPELDRRHKPCYVKSRGEYNGSFIRGGDGDRRLTEYEISLLHANRGQPHDDRTPVSGTTTDDLDPDAVARLLRRVRTRQPSAFQGVADEVALRRLGVLVRHADRLVPSIAGILALGRYPQEFLPQLNVTFVAIPGTSKDAIPPGGPRFLDNRTINGPIPVIVEETLNALIRNMSVRAVVNGAGREDIYDFPVEALREAVANALMHRDYSDYARGTQVQVELYSDRLVVRNPGGLYGAVTADDLGDEGVSSSRNPHLATLLQDVTLPDSNRVVCENRGTGIPTMLAVLRRAGMSTPAFDSRISRFTVTFPKQSLLSTSTIEWIQSLGQPGLSQPQCMALALMRDGRHVSNASLRQLGLDSRDAGLALADLVSRGLAVRVGGRRYASYVLSDVETRPKNLQLELLDESDQPKPRQGRRDRTAEVLALFDRRESLALSDVTARTGLSSVMASRYLEQLIASGDLESTAPPRSRHRRYRRANG